MGLTDIMIPDGFYICRFGYKIEIIQWIGYRKGGIWLRLDGSKATRHPDKICRPIPRDFKFSAANEKLPKLPPKLKKKKNTTQSQTELYRDHLGRFKKAELA